jgi:hypothetical protein
MARAVRGGRAQSGRDAQRGRARAKGRTVSASEPMQEAGLRALLDEREIRGVLLRYCRAVDRLDEPLLRSCYHPDARDEHGSFAGSVDEYVAWAFRLLQGYATTMHLLGNVLVEVSGDVALAESYGISFHRTEPKEGELFEPRRNLTVGFRLVDRFERRGGEWRIARRVATTEWSRVDDLAGRWPAPAHLRRGARDASDPIYWLVPELSRRER